MQVELKNETVHISELTLGRVVTVTLDWLSGPKTPKFGHLTGFDVNCTNELIFIVRLDGTDIKTHPSNVTLTKPVKARLATASTILGGDEPSDLFPTNPLTVRRGMLVGDLVVATNGETLRSGAEWYPMAVVVQVNPLVLVSEDAAMRWNRKQPTDFKVIGVTDEETLDKCSKRLQDDK